MIYCYYNVSFQNRFVRILLNDYVLKFMGSMCVFGWNFVEGLCVEIMISMCDFVEISMVTNVKLKIEIY